MTGFAVYSSETDPQRLYATGDTTGLESDRVGEMVRAGDRPLDFLVDLGARELLWSVKADRLTASRRTGYFVAAYQSDDDLFKGFADELRTLHDQDDWAVPYAGEPRWDVGFELWRVPSDTPGLRGDQFDDLCERLDGPGESKTVTFGMEGYRSAVQVLRALDNAAVDCTVGIGTGSDAAANLDVDLFFKLGSDGNFHPRSAAAHAIVADAESTSEGHSTDLTLTTSANSRGSFGSRIASAFLLVFLGFALYSFISPTPVQPLTGLATLGGLVGSGAAVLIGTSLADSTDAVRSDGGTALRTALNTNRDRWLVVLGCGTLVGFAFPRVAWEAGAALGFGGFPFGSITTLAGSLPTTAGYVAGVFAVSITGLALQQLRTEHDYLSGGVLLPLVVGHVAYGLGLAFATGLADRLWYLLIPSAPV